MSATVGADSADFNRVAVDREVLGGSAADDGALDTAVVELRSVAAGLADKKLSRACVARPTAADEGVQGRESMHQPLFQQKF